MRAYTSQLIVGAILVSVVIMFVWYVRATHDSESVFTELYVMGAPEYNADTDGVFLAYAVRNRTGVDHTYGVRGSVSVADADFATVFARDVFVRDGEVRVLRDLLSYDIFATSTIRIEIPDLRQSIYINVSPPS